MNNEHEEPLKYKPMVGQHIRDAAEAAIDLSLTSGRKVSFEIHDVEVIVTGRTTVDEAVQFFLEAERILLGIFKRHAGEYRGSPECKVAADAAIDEKTKGIQLEFADAAAWKKIVEINAADNYGSAAVRYAERWAKLMQVEMAAGKKLEDIAGKASREANSEGASNIMYAAAVSVLARTWKYGEQLRRWDDTGRTARQPSP